MRIDHAKVTKDIVLDALTQYSNQAPKQLNALKSSSDKVITQFKAMGQKVNFKIAEAKEIAKIRDEVIGSIAGLAIGAAGPVLAVGRDEIQEAVHEFKDGLTWGSKRRTKSGSW